MKYPKSFINIFSYKRQAFFFFIRSESFSLNTSIWNNTSFVLKNNQANALINVTSNFPLCSHGWLSKTHLHNKFKFHRVIVQLFILEVTLGQASKYSMVKTLSPTNQPKINRKRITITKAFQTHLFNILWRGIHKGMAANSRTPA